MNTSVLITNHLTENLPYLRKACEGHRGGDYQVTVISSAEIAPVIEQDNVRVLHRRDLSNATKKVNFFMDGLTKKYALIQSDDVVVSSNIISVMEQSAFAMQTMGPVVQTPLSNNEEGSRFVSFAPTWLNKKDLNIEEMPEVNFKQLAPSPILLPVEWFAFYCAFIPKEVFDKIGLDEALENRYNDVDFCLRARKIGVVSAVNMGCFAFHYGTRTLRKTVTPEMYAEADAYWQNKVLCGAV